MLRIKSSDKIVSLPPGAYLLGRCLPCHLILRSRTVSAEHCRIWHQDEAWFIRDLGSTNGTLLDGVRLIPQREYPLPALSLVRIGGAMLSLEQTAQATPSILDLPIVLGGEQEETSSLSPSGAQKIESNPSPAFSKPHLESHSPRIKAVYAEAAELAQSRLPVAIEGETGTGKELLARFIHQASGRSGNLITLIPNTSESLQESEFFGYKKGAFTGADRDYPGKIRLAEQGTLFLDELSHIPQSLQVRLLRFLENGEIFPLGGHAAERVDVRILVASNIPFKTLLQNGNLRRDVYYRLCSHILTLPPLRERPQDIVPLFGRFLGLPEIPAMIAALLLAYPWPGNVRELKGEAERVQMRLNGSSRLTPDLLSPILLGHTVTLGPSELNTCQERETLNQALHESRGNKSLAARQLGISRRGLYKKLKRLGLDAL